MNTVLNSYGQLYGCPEILKKSYKFFCRGLDIRVIQVLKTLGKTNVTSKTIQTLSSRLNEDDKAAMLREAAESTDWVYNAIRQIAGEVQ